MIVRVKEPTENGVVLDRDSEGFYYVKVEPSPDMPFSIPDGDFEIISPF